MPDGHQADEDEGDAEQLAHVERHRSLEGFLVLLDELDEEARREDEDEEDAEEESLPVFGGGAPVKAHEDEEGGQVAEGLVELGGVARRLGVGHAAVDEAEAPRHGGGLADNLGVHEVARADEESGEGDGDDGAVEHPEDGFVADLAGVVPQAGDDADGGAVAGQSLVAREAEFRLKAHGEYHLDDVLAVVVPVVEDAVAEAGTDDGGDGDVNPQLVEPFLGQVLGLEHALLDFVAEDESEGEEHAVVADGEAADVEYLGADVPSDVELR